MIVSFVVRFIVKRDGSIDNMYYMGKYYYNTLFAICAY